MQVVVIVLNSISTTLHLAFKLYGCFGYSWGLDHVGRNCCESRNFHFIFTWFEQSTTVICRFEIPGAHHVHYKLSCTITSSTLQYYRKTIMYSQRCTQIIVPVWSTLLRVSFFPFRPIFIPITTKGGSWHTTLKYEYGAQFSAPFAS